MNGKPPQYQTLAYPTKKKEREKTKKVLI